MKKLKYEDVEKVYMENLRKNGLYFRPGYPPEEDNFAKGVFVMLETLVDSINECIEPCWKGKKVKFKQTTKLISTIPNGNGNDYTFPKGMVVLCSDVFDDTIKIIAYNKMHKIAKESVYLCEEE